MATQAELHIPGVLEALMRLQLPFRLIQSGSTEDKQLTEWTERSFPWEFSQIDWSKVARCNCVQYTSLEDLVPEFLFMTETLNRQGQVIVMWCEGQTPVLEMKLEAVRTISREIFEEHETSTNTLVFSPHENWLIEMHHEGTLCFGESSPPQ